MSYQREKRVAIEAVRKAANLCKMVRSDMVGADSLEKGDRSPVTIADFGAQALVCHALRQAFPNDPIVAEEDSRDLGQPEAVHADKLGQVTHYVCQFHPDVPPQIICDWIDAGNGSVSDRYWTLDPIDGTKGFLRNDQYAVALALVEEGQVKVAALACPALPLNLDESDNNIGSLFVAVRGGGAAMAGLESTEFSPIQVQKRVNHVRARFVESVEPGHGNQDLQQAVAQAVGISQLSLRMDSQAKYGAVARGDAALYLRLPSPKSPHYREKIWDHAAGTLVVEEAGGRVTDMFGQALDFASDYKMQNNRGVIVSNGVLHPAVIQALKRTQSTSQAA
jgi:3'(2'), 5'-bisphosphate nucleotidase